MWKIQWQEWAPSNWVVAQSSSMWSPNPLRLWQTLSFALHKFTEKLYSWRQSLHFSLNTKNSRWNLTGVLIILKSFYVLKMILCMLPEKRVKPQSLHLQWWTDCLQCWYNASTNAVAITRHCLIVLKDYSTRLKTFLILLSWPRIELDR